MSILNLEMFKNEKELSQLTGLNHEELWDEGFDLDDWDVGFLSPKKLTDSNAWWLLRVMDNYCCGYKITEYDDKYYYLVYHS